ncbi:hypothetical protein A2276_00785 [candidate division WOR-1 bacterium RIFOXYA12_FULL_43_27]|uniref:Ferredoxin n=1 Tax=candidate division WOR-1 bacterium RIFOXYC2_FULL_46_14 TaxID=1802587 RepID=A0A1F4U6H0_UNCSA|nr:MAG: hypothetical protein A2276_00785 [candidate division WOR-1 bacterium RIFOXYA12_FULL_43_27]OGC20777.1 MAG: hypothetical protein A2292_07090 [candidate division WOR-1 bacterium RIFOXYB2_FULL_46_45]OGC31486.1 MAG: hypothetical protein A2232_04360 [candidate division WOR-1 bacterium RIFOXYA2_FULL_46_56]OGC39893.1 MAG: hypothetical protein A2438_05200 [candidate division WOR-1 bacterium RIFOXYC2_FULL_46_14]
MTIRVDESLCIGCGLCIDACGEVFGMSSDGKAIVKSQHCESGNAGNLEEIEDMCPVDAILIEE